MCDRMNSAMTLLHMLRVVTSNSVLSMTPALFCDNDNAGLGGIEPRSLVSSGLTYYLLYHPSLSPLTRWSVQKLS